MNKLQFLRVRATELEANIVFLWTDPATNRDLYALRSWIGDIWSAALPLDDIEEALICFAKYLELERRYCRNALPGDQLRKAIKKASDEAWRDFRKRPGVHDFPRPINA